MIKIYRFQDAPKSLQRLSHHGGDEDWVVVGNPAQLSGSPFDATWEWRGFVGEVQERGYLAGWGWVQRITRGDKVVIIFAHA